MSSLIKAVLGLGLALIGLNGLSVAAQQEIVQLETTDPRGGVHRTSLWVADLDRRAWLRASDPAALWLARVRAEPRVWVVREGVRRPYHAVPVPAMQGRLGEAMRAKYGRADAWLARIRDPGDAVAIRLDPGSEAAAWGEVYP